MQLCSIKLHKKLWETIIILNLPFSSSPQPLLKNSCHLSGLPISFSMPLGPVISRCLWGLSPCRQLHVNSICVIGIMQSPESSMNDRCEREGRDTQMRIQESLQGNGSKRKIRMMVFWIFLFELPSGWQPRPEQERFWTYSKNCPLLRVKGELTAPPTLTSHRFLLYVLTGILPYASN